MIKIKAKIHLFKGKNKRQIPLYSAYRPVFQFKNNIATSGHIILTDREKVRPGETATVRILFAQANHLKNGDEYIEHFSFREGKEVLGEGVLIDVYHSENTQDILTTLPQSNPCDFELDSDKKILSFKLIGENDKLALDFFGVACFRHFHDTSLVTGKKKITLLNPSKWKDRFQLSKNQPNPKLNHMRIIFSENEIYEILCEYYGIQHKKL